MNNRPGTRTSKATTVRVLLRLRRGELGRAAKRWYRSVLNRFGVALLPLAVPAGLIAQDPISIVLRGPDCQRCAVALEHEVDLGTFDGPGALVRERGIETRVGALGQYYANQNDHLVVFDSAGRFQTTIGRGGGGPGEYRRIGRVAVGMGDMLHIFDNGNRRYTTTTAVGTVVSTVPYPMRSADAVPLPNGAAALAAVVVAPNRPSRPIHIVANGRIVRSMGRTVSPSPERPFAARHRLASSTGGTFWSARFDEYVVERFDTTGIVQMTLTRPVPWFDANRDRSDVFDDGPPTLVQDMVEDAQGLLWIMVTTADPNFSEGFDYSGRHPDGPHLPVVGNHTKLVDTVIDVIDPERGVVVASTRFDEAMEGFAAPGMVYGPIVNADGVPAVRVWRISHARP